MDILAIAVQKGGTGKTSTAAALAQAATKDGKKVLCIDLDPQCNFTFAMGCPPAAKTTFDLMNGTPAAQLIVKTSQGADMIPAAWGLGTLTTFKGSARRLAKAIEPLNNVYDLVIIDTPPIVGELQFNALQAATGVIIPLQADVYNIQSLFQIMQTIDLIKASNPKLTVKGIVFTMHDARSTLAKQMRAAVEDKANALGVPCLGAIRRGIAIGEAAAMQQSLFEYAPKSKPAQDYWELYEKIR